MLNRVFELTHANKIKVNFLVLNKNKVNQNKLLILYQWNILHDTCTLFNDNNIEIFLLLHRNLKEKIFRKLLLQKNKYGNTPLFFLFRKLSVKARISEELQNVLVFSVGVVWKEINNEKKTIFTILVENRFNGICRDLIQADDINGKKKMVYFIKTKDLHKRSVLHTVCSRKNDSVFDVTNLILNFIKKNAKNSQNIYKIVLHRDAVKNNSMHCCFYSNSYMTLIRCFKFFVENTEYFSQKLKKKKNPFNCRNKFYYTPLQFGLFYKNILMAEKWLVDYVPEGENEKLYYYGQKISIQKTLLIVNDGDKPKLKQILNIFFEKRENFLKENGAKEVLQNDIVEEDNVDEGNENDVQKEEDEKL